VSTVTGIFCEAARGEASDIGALVL
jgi:hypothetical protein